VALLQLADALASLPVALDGESAGGSSTPLAVIAVASMVFGYVLLACLWHFVFRERARSRRRKDSSE
jgi:hypothetical protein